MVIKHQFSGQQILTVLKLIAIYCFIAILDITLETILSHYAKLMRIDKRNFATPLPKFNAVNSAETTFGNLPCMTQVRH